MTFLYPFFLWALLGLSIPIIIHLFFFRRFKKVYFSNTKLLKEIKEETSSRNKLKNLLVLLMRCLAIASLVFAFAQPYIPTSKKLNLGTKSVSVFIDNSYSMNAEKENVPLLEIAKQRAREIVNAYNETDRFQILTHEFDGKYQRLVTKEEALVTIDNIATTPQVNNLSSILKRQNQVLKGDSKLSYLLSDFQTSITDLEGWQDSSFMVNLLPIQSNLPRNVSIDSAWFATPVPIINQNNSLVVKLRNYGDTPAEGIKATVTIDGQEKPLGLIDIPAKGEVIDTMSISIVSPGRKKAVIKIQDYPIQFDDEYFITFEVPEKINILAINDATPNKYIKALFSGLSYFQLDEQNLNQIQYQKFNSYQLIVLNDIKSINSGLSNELSKYIRQGGKVVVFPSLDADINTYNTFLTNLGAATILTKEKKAIDVTRVNTNDFVFNDVFEYSRTNITLPKVQSFYLFGVTGVLPSESLLEFANGNSYMNKYKIENGQIYICASPLNEQQNNLVLNAEIFVPMLFKMSIARNNPEPLGFKIGLNKMIEITHENTVGNDIVYKIKGENEFIPGQRKLENKLFIDVGNQIKSPGFYNLMLDQTVQKELAFNFNRKESDLTLASLSELESKSSKNASFKIINADAQKTLPKIVKENSTGLVLWKWFLWAALIFLLLEMLFVRLMKS